MSVLCVPSAEQVVGDVHGSEDGRYAAAVDYLFGLINYERVAPSSTISRDFRLDRIRALLEALGSPQERSPAVHIAGTKGKGSTAAMLSAMLVAGGIRTGLFTSPHVHKFEERMTVNGDRPSPEEIVSFTETVRIAADTLSHTTGFGPPTFFEVTTAMAWLFFQSRQAEIVILETGLGGRLDATNVCRPILTIITSISRDHMHLLGETLPEIAAEKSGIIKPGVPVISGVGDAAARRVIARVAVENLAPLVQLGETLHLRNAHERTLFEPASPGMWTGDVETPTRTYARISAPLAGAHQLTNAALAVAALDRLRLQGVSIDDGIWESGLRRVQWPLRIEVLRRQPLVIVDAAHNDSSIQALLETISGIPARRRHLIFGTSRDKDVDAMLQLLSGQFDEVVLTRYVSNPRAHAVDLLADAAQNRDFRGFATRPDPPSAWELVEARAHDDDLICVTGSFFLAAEFRELLHPATGSLASR
jgi:dihydrofolate synthase / folylpolyglutamate synthase